MKNIQKLTAVEEQLMLVLWQLGEFRLKEVLELHPEPVPHQNTISTYLKILTEKGFIVSKRDGRGFVYKRTVEKDEYAEFLMRNFIDEYFSSSKEFVDFLIEKEMIPTDEHKKHEIEYPIAEAILESVGREKKKKKSKKKTKKKK